MRAGVIVVIALAGLSVCCLTASAQEFAYASNDLKLESELPEGSYVNQEAIRFIVSSAGARMIGAEEGRLAAQRGTTHEIQAYGELMIKDQGRLLGELKRLAVLKSISVPEEVQETELRTKSSKHFNNSFIKKMIAEHERDIKLFKDAITCGDADVSAFAAQYLPLIESHLEKIKAIKRRS